MTEVRSLHDHEASQARVELAQVRDRLNESAQSSAFASAGQIFHASIASCLNEVLAILPKESVIKRTINNHKALPPIELVGLNGIGQIPETYSLKHTLGARLQHLCIRYRNGEISRLDFLRLTATENVAKNVFFQLLLNFI